MSTMAAPGAARARAARRAAARRRVALVARRGRARRRRVGALLPTVDEAVQEVTLPLRHDDIIRQQAADKDLDPSLIAAVIYAESRFRDATSHAGARGLMQITPQTARRDRAALGRRRSSSRATSATPQINISYGSWYLRWLLDRYGEQRDARGRRLQRGHRQRRQVDRARPGHAAPARSRSPRRATYVAKVLDARADYQREYARELGL